MSDTKTKGDKTKKWLQNAEDSSAEHVLPVRPHRVPALFYTGKVHEVTGPVHLVVELLRVGQSQLIAHVRVVSHPHKIIIPGTLKKDN